MPIGIGGRPGLEGPPSAAREIAGGGFPIPPDVLARLKTSSGFAPSYLDQYVPEPTGNALVDTYNIRQAIAALLGSSDPATTIRTPLGALVLAGGTYKINSDILIQSVMGFHMKCAGKELTILQATGTGFTTAVLNVDGSAYGTFEGFTIIGDGTEQVPNAIAQQWTSAAYRSTTQNVWTNINVRDLNFVNGWNATGNNQNDGTLLTAVDITGGQVAGAWSDTGNWQAAYAFGGGSYGNNMNHWMIGCSGGNCYRNVYVNASSVHYLMGEPAANGCEFFISAPVSACSIKGVESEGSGQFVNYSTASSATPFSVEDFRFTCGNLQSNGQWFASADGLVGPVAVKRGLLVDPPAGVTPVYATNGQSNPSQHELEDVVVITGVATPLITDAITYGYGQALERIQVKNFTLGNSAGGYVRFAKWANYGNQPQPSPPAVPASGTAQANTYDIPVNVIVAGGIVTDIAVNGNSTGLTSGAIYLQPTDTFTLTYSTAPTLTWLGAS